MSSNEEYLSAVMAKDSIPPEVFDLLIVAAQQSSNDSWLCRLYDRRANLTGSQLSDLLGPASLQRIFLTKHQVATELAGRPDRTARLQDLVEALHATTNDHDRAEMASALFAAALTDPLELEIALEIARSETIVINRVTSNKAALLCVLEHLAPELDVEPGVPSDPSEYSDDDRLVLGRLTRLRDAVMRCVLELASTDRSDLADIRDQAIVLSRQMRQKPWFIPRLAVDTFRINRKLLDILGEDEQLITLLMQEILRWSGRVNPDALIANDDVAIAQAAVLELPWASPLNPSEASRKYHVQMMEAVAARIGPDPAAHQLLMSLANDWEQSGAALVEATLLALTKNEQAA